MKTSSAKAKGRKLQQWVRDTILKLTPTLTLNDVRSTSMGAGGRDVQLSEAAKRLWPFAIECKSMKAFSVYGYYEQAREHAEPDEVPLVIIKKNGEQPLAILDATLFMSMVKELNNGKEGERA